ncbi:MAG TPA: iron-sulfur cluster carrier protein ApbC [Stellaceae bacterium]|nr:iron-sulfur cluster carrier protein ApbC [Stellaceae bacterium]
MTDVTQDRILAALRQVKDPERGGDIVSLGMVSGLQIREGHVGFAIEVDPERGPHLEPLRKAAEKAVADLDGVLSASVVLTAHKQAARPAPRQQQPGAHAGHRHAPQKPLVPEVRSIVAVASGKGGVGKSTVAVNLALALAANGLRVGLLDADIYGPSQPRLLGLTGRPQTKDGKTLEPMEAFGLKTMSIGFLVNEDQAMIWRGPMVMSALQQMLRDVNWGALDVLVVDMPPGTGDAQLTMAQQVPLAGAVIVSTPQDLALIDARKGIAMFRKVEVPILGIVENMSYFLCPHCGERTDIFAHGGARHEAEKLGVPFLGEVPLDLAIRETSDGGRPLVASAPDSEHAQIFRRMAAQVAGQLGAEPPAPPKIVVE